ncbi:MAG: response regulator, partial [Pyrinomonadaceae bacterium]
MAPEIVDRPQVLIVDDEKEITDLLSDALGANYDCVTASTAEEALDRMKECDFQLVITDITMPGMSGLEMIPHVKSISPNGVIVMISGMQTVESAIDALRLG